MVTFEDLFFNSSDYGLKFYNQRLVKLFGRIDGMDFCHTLTKDDVIFCIKSYISRIHLCDKHISIRCERVDFCLFYMHDLVPYLYSLVNLYLTKLYAYDNPYSRVLPVLNLTQFCQLPFEEDIIIEHDLKPVLRVKYAILEIDKFHVTKYVCLNKYGIACAYDSLKDLKHYLEEVYPEYCIKLCCDFPL